MQQPFGQTVAAAPWTDKAQRVAGIGGKGGEGAVDRAVGREVIAVAHLEARDHGELLICSLAGHALTPERRCLPQRVMWRLRPRFAIPWRVRSVVLLALLHRGPVKTVGGSHMIRRC